MNDARETIARAILDRMRDPKGYTVEDLADAALDALGLVAETEYAARWRPLEYGGTETKLTSRRYVTPWGDLP